MKTLNRLIHSLNENEWDTLLKFLTVFPNKNEPWRKILQLAKLLRQEKDENLSAKIYSERISGNENKAAIVRIGQMLRNKVLESFSLPQNNTRNTKSDSGDALIRLTKKSLQFHQTRLARPIPEVSMGLLDEIIKLSKEYEHYPALTDHLVWKRHLYCLQLGPKKYQEIEQEIQFYKKCRESTTLAFDYLSRLKLLSYFNNENKKIFLKRAILTLQKRHNKYESNIVLYILKQLQLEYCLSQKLYKKAKKKCSEIINVLKSKSVFSEYRLGIVYSLIAQTEIHLNQFHSSISYSRKSLQCFPKDSSNYMFSKEGEFYGLFYSKNYSEAKECIEYILSKSLRYELGEFRYAQYNFFLANALLKQSRHHEALSILNEKLEISMDKVGWEISLRVLKIMVTIEIGDLNWADKQIESLRRFCLYTDKKRSSISHRNKSIITALILLGKNNFCFTGLNDKTKKCIANLRNKKAYKWEHFSPELIPFHEWIQEKTN